MAGRQTKKADEETKTENERLKRPISVYVKKKVRIEVEKIAEKEGLTRHSVLSYAISYFVREYKQGRAKIEKQTVPKDLDV
jgi:hypothetical protein